MATACRSEPVPGSVMAMAPTNWPVAIFGSQRCFCPPCRRRGCSGDDAAVKGGHRGAAKGASLLFDQHLLVGEVAAAATVLLGDARAQNALLPGLEPEFAIHVALIVPALEVGLALGFEELARRLAENFSSSDLYEPWARWGLLGMEGLSLWGSWRQGTSVERKSAQLRGDVPCADGR